MTRYTITATASAVIPASATVIFDMIAEYLHQHPRILPPEHFTFLAVDSGGWGAGTRIRSGMQAFGRLSASHSTVSEPVPGDELRDGMDDGLVTTFLVEPRGSYLTRVTIETVYQRSGLGGLLERLVVPSFLRRVYEAELDLLAREATGAAAPSIEHDAFCRRGGSPPCARTLVSSRRSPRPDSPTGFQRSEPCKG